jgi:hypothetical protein
VSPVIDTRPRLLARALVQHGVFADEAIALAHGIARCSGNAARYAVARAALRPLHVGATTTREVLQAAGLWEREPCALVGCTRELHAKKAIVVIRERGYCSVGCALVAIGAAP